MANVFRATLNWSVAALPACTKCGTALNLPPVMTCNASPVWKARQSEGMETLVTVESRA